VALQANHARASGADHFELNAIAEAKLAEALHLIGSTDNFGNDATLTVGQATERNMF
jgi:hypothetical protein